MHKRTRAVIRTGKGRARSTGLRWSPRTRPVRKKPRKMSESAKKGLSNLRTINSELSLGLRKPQLTLVRDSLNLSAHGPALRGNLAAKKKFSSAKRILHRAVVKADKNRAARIMADMTRVSTEFSQRAQQRAGTSVASATRQGIEVNQFTAHPHSPAEIRDFVARAQRKAIVDVARRERTIGIELKHVQREQASINNWDFNTRHDIESVATLIGHVSPRKKSKRKK